MKFGNCFITKISHIYRKQIISLIISFKRSTTAIHPKAQHSGKSPNVPFANRRFFLRLVICCYSEHHADVVDSFPLHRVGESFDNQLQKPVDTKVVRGLVEEIESKDKRDRREI